MNLSAKISEKYQGQLALAERLTLDVAGLVTKRPLFWRLRATLTCRKLKLLALKTPGVTRAVQRAQQNHRKIYCTAILPELVRHGAIQAATDFLYAGASPTLQSANCQAVSMQQFATMPTSPVVAKFAEAFAKSLAAHRSSAKTELAEIAAYIKRVAEQRPASSSGYSLPRWPIPRIRGLSQALPVTTESYLRLAGVFLALIKSNRLTEANEILVAVNPSSVNFAKFVRQVSVNLEKSRDLLEIFGCSSERDLARWTPIVRTLCGSRPKLLAEALNDIASNSASFKIWDFAYRLFAAAAAGRKIGVLNDTEFSSIAQRCADELLKNWPQTIDYLRAPSPAYLLGLKVVADLADQLQGTDCWTVATIVRSFDAGNVLHSKLMRRLRAEDQTGFPVRLISAALRGEVFSQRIERLRPVIDTFASTAPSQYFATQALAVLSAGVLKRAPDGPVFSSRQHSEILYAIDSLLKLGASYRELGASGSPLFIELLRASERDAETVSFFEKSAIYSRLQSTVLGDAPTAAEQAGLSIAVNTLADSPWVEIKGNAPETIAALRLLSDLLNPAGTGVPLLTDLSKVAGQILKGDTRQLVELLELTEDLQFKGKIRSLQHVNEAEFLVILAAALIRNNTELANVMSNLITATHRWADSSLDGMPRALGELYGRCGVLSHSFKRWKFFFRVTGGSSLAERFGFKRHLLTHTSNSKQPHTHCFILSADARKNIRDRYVLGVMHSLTPETECVFARGFIPIKNKYGCLLIRNSSKTFGRSLLLHPAYYSGRSDISLASLAANISDSYLRNQGFVNVVAAPIYTSVDSADKPAHFLNAIRPLFADLELILANMDAWLFDTDRETAWIGTTSDPNFNMLIGAHFSPGFQALLSFLSSHNENSAPLQMAFIDPTLPPFAFHSSEPKNSRKRGLDRITLNYETIADLTALAAGNHLPASNPTVKLINSAGLMTQGTLFIFDSND